MLYVYSMRALVVITWVALVVALISESMVALAVSLIAATWGIIIGVERQFPRL